MQWWCSSGGTGWTWEWQPYIGVWVFLAVTGVALWRVVFQPSPREELTLRHTGVLALALALLWAGLDWPLAALGSSYLISVHVLQFLIIGLLVPALLLLAVPPSAYRRLANHPRVVESLRGITQPLAAFFVFNVGISIVHWPTVVDTLMASQWGSFALNMSWLVLGLVFWWPVLSPVPDWPRFSHSNLFKMGYLAVNAVMIRPPSAIMLFSRFPAYATYELAPPIPGTNALDDQQLAGAIMKVGSAWIMAAGIGLLAYRWYRESMAEQRNGVEG